MNEKQFERNDMHTLFKSALDTVGPKQFLIWIKLNAWVKIVCGVRSHAHTPNWKQWIWWVDDTINVSARMSAKEVARLVRYRHLQQCFRISAKTKYNYLRFDGLCLKWLTVDGDLKVWAIFLAQFLVIFMSLFRLYCVDARVQICRISITPSSALWRIVYISCRCQSFGSICTGVLRIIPCMRV